MIRNKKSLKNKSISNSKSLQNNKNPKKYFKQAWYSGIGIIIFGLIFLLNLSNLFFHFKASEYLYDILSFETGYIIILIVIALFFVFFMKGFVTLGKYYESKMIKYSSGILQIIFGIFFVIGLLSIIFILTYKQLNLNPDFFWIFPMAFTILIIPFMVSSLIFNISLIIVNNKLLRFIGVFGLIGGSVPFGFINYYLALINIFLLIVCFILSLKLFYNLSKKSTL
jgi:hypothetical protein